MSLKVEGSSSAILYKNGFKNPYENENHSQKLKSHPEEADHSTEDNHSNEPRSPFKKSKTTFIHSYAKEGEDAEVPPF